MSTSLLCQGCGSKVLVPDNFTRARIRCPQCGVMCEVPQAPSRKEPPPPKAKKSPSPRLEDEAGDLLSQEDPVPPVRPVNRIPDIQERPVRKVPKPKLAFPPPSVEYDYSDDEEDSKPYLVHGLDEERPCPECRRQIPRDAVLCNFCGFDLRVGKKIVREFQTFDRTWTAGLAYGWRIGIFLFGQALTIPGVIWGVSNYGNIFGIVSFWLTATAMSAFLFGTFNRITLTRNKKGRVHIITRWWMCFLPRAPIEVDVHEYGGVAYGLVDEVTSVEWITFFLLIGSGILPGLIFGYLFVFRPSSQVALTRDHGYSDLIVYRGHDRDLMLEIAQTIRKVAHLPDT